MRTTLVLLVLLAGPALASQTVWKWVDDKGVTHYSDRAVPGATKMELNVRSRSGAAEQAPASQTSPEPADTQATAGPPYQEFAIWQPSDGDALINTGGVVTANVRLEPGLQPGHSVYLYLDGRLVEGASGNTLSFELQEVPRGSHTLIAVVNDDRGQRLQETATVRFTVRQESIAQPPVGPALRPPPRTQPRPGAAKLPVLQPSYAALNATRPNVDPVTNRPVVTKPAVTPGPRRGP